MRQASEGELAKLHARYPRTCPPGYCTPSLYLCLWSEFVGRMSVSTHHFAALAAPQRGETARTALRVAGLMGEVHEQRALYQLLTHNKSVGNAKSKGETISAPLQLSSENGPQTATHAGGMFLDPGPSAENHTRALLSLQPVKPASTSW